MIMNKSRLYIISLLLCGAALMTLPSCSDDDFGPSIFDEKVDELDPNSVTYEFDKWLEDNFRKPYNIRYIYKMEDVGTNMNYNFVPANYNNAVDLALLVKYLWLDAYSAVAQDGADFLKQNAPRVIHVIGSAAMSPSSGTETFDLANGGVKVSLFKVNQMSTIRENDPTGWFKTMNTYYFASMHRVFSTILYQKINYPKEFDEISNSKYDVTSWSTRGGTDHDGVVNSLGFVTKYASQAKSTDFQEIVAQRVTMTDEQWETMLDLAAKGWHAVPLSNGTTAYASHYYFTNNRSGDDNKAYILPSLNLDYASNEAGDTLTLLKLGKPQYQTAEGKVTTEKIYDASGNYVRDLNTDETGAQVKRGPDGTWLAIDAKGEFIPIKVYPVEDEDEVDGATAILQKLSLATKWFSDQWGVDIEKLRAFVQKRQNEYRNDPEGVIKRLRKEALGHE